MLVGPYLAIPRHLGDLHNRPVPGGRNALTFAETNRRRARGTAPPSLLGGVALRDDGQMAESQLSELRNMRVLLEEARGLARNLAYHRRARLEAVLGQALEEVDQQIEELRSERRS